MARPARGRDREEAKSVLIVSQPTTFGIARHLVPLAEGLTGRGWDVTVACPMNADFSRQLTGLGISVVNLPMVRDIRLLSDLGSFMRLFRLCRRLRPKVLHVHSSKAGFLGRVAGRLAGVPVIVFTPHCWSFQSVEGRRRAFYIQLERIASRFCDITIAVSQQEATEAIRVGVLSPERIRVIHNGVADKEFVAATGGSRDIPFLSVGRLEEQKGYTYLLEAMAELSHLESGVRLSIVGDGALRDDLERQSASLGLQNVVRFEGEQNDVRPFLRRAHVFVLSSLWEGLPYTVIEAMASHLPVVSTDVGGCPELVRQAETGLLVPARDPSALASAMRALWRDDALSVSMGNAGYDRARRHFRLDSCVAQNSEVYDEFLGRYRMSHREQRRGSLMGARATAAVLTATALLAGAVVVSEASIANRIPHGVRVGGSAVGGQTIAQASRSVGDLASRPITVSVSATSTGMPVSGADLNLDVMSALDQAYLVGRVGALPQRVAQRVAAYRGQVTVPLKAGNRGVVADLLAGVRQQLERTPVDAGFEMVGAELKVTPESPGVRVAEGPFLTRLGEAVTSPEAADRVAVVPVESLPASLTTAQLTRLAPQARKWTGRDLVGSTPSATYALSRPALASLLTVRDGGLAVSEARTASALDGLSIPSNPPRDARMVVVDQTVRILDGAPGTQIDASATAQSIQSAMETGQGGFSIVTKDREPNVTRADLERLGIDRQLSTFTTHFVLGQDGRDTNISLAASALRGTILGIGEDFSLNQVTGPRNRSTGYKESLIFSNGKVVPGVGGGVCQVATTTYQAALRANLRILDRQAHSMAVSYVAPGLDATAFYPIVDLKFQNSTSGPILLWSEVKGNALTVSVYGSGVLPDVRIETVLKKTMPQATRTVVDPSLAPGTKVVQSEGVPGYIVDSYRVIYQDGRVVKRELLASDEYRPRDRIVLVGN